jgi:hypothetical protein
MARIVLIVDDRAPFRATARALVSKVNLLDIETRA